MKLIDEREREVVERAVVEHLERDTIHGKDVNQRTLTLVDRKTRMLFASKADYEVMRYTKRLQTSSNKES